MGGLRVILTSEAQNTADQRFSKKVAGEQSAWLGFVQPPRIQIAENLCLETMAPRRIIMDIRLRLPFVILSLMSLRHAFGAPFSVLDAYSPACSLPSDYSTDGMLFQLGLACSRICPVNGDCDNASQRLLNI